MGMQTGKKHRFGRRVRPLSRHVDLLDRIDACIHCLVVHLENGLALPAVGVVDGVLHIFHGVVYRNDIGQLEECGLHDHVDPVAKTELLADVRSIEDIKLNIVVCKGASHP